MDFDNMTVRLWNIPWPPPDIPDPMSVPFRDLEGNIKAVVSELWKGRRELEARSPHLHPIWKASLRMTVMFLNQSDAFHGCGAKLLEEGSNEQAFIEKYKGAKGKTERIRACGLLARTAFLLRMMGFRSPLISIGRDLHYSGVCEETRQLLTGLRAAPMPLNRGASEHGKASDAQMIAMFTELLVHIGGAEGFMSQSGERHRKAREIGEALNEMGGLNLMQSVAGRVIAMLQMEGRVLGRELEFCWDGIGEWIA